MEVSKEINNDDPEKGALSVHAYNVAAAACPRLSGSFLEALLHHRKYACLQLSIFDSW